MLLQVFSVRDSKVGAYMEPIYLVNEQTALRALSNCLRDRNHSFYMNPEDYSLYILGEYDDAVGKFTLLDAPEHLCNLIDLVNASDQELSGE